MSAKYRFYRPTLTAAQQLSILLWLLAESVSLKNTRILR